MDINQINIKNIDEELALFEALIAENIPRDLAAAYKSANRYESQRNVQTAHDELRSYNRRSVNYDYGKSNYDPISAEDAIQLVRANKSDIQKLRIIYDGDLVEYEVRDNGSVYAIYGDSSNSVTFNGKTYKNIRYVPWRTVLQNADKIYITDEYDHPLFNDAETQQRRQKATQVKMLGAGGGTDQAGYNPHKPFDNFVRSASKFPGTLDSGAHNISQRYDGVSMLGKNTVYELTNAIERMNTAYTRYDLARRYFKKLLSEKDDYTDSEYELLYADAQEKVTDRLQRYEALAKKVSDLKSKVITNVDAKTLEVNTKIQSYLKTFQDLLDRGYHLKQEFETLLVRTVDNDIENDYRARKLRDTIQTLIDKILQAQRELEAMQDESTGEMPQDTPAIISAAQDIDSKLAELDTIKTDFIQRQIKQFNSIEKALAKVDQKLAALRPKAAAAKAAKAAKNRTPELDPALANIVQFTDFIGSDE